MENRQNFTDKFDWNLAFLLLLFLAVSILGISSAQVTGQYAGRNFMFMQIFWYGVGAGIITGCLFLEPEQFKKLSWYFYGFGMLLLVGLLIAPETIARPINGAKSWYQTPVGSIQPSEFMKIFLILILARIVSTHHEKVTNKSVQTDFTLLMKIGLVSVPPLGLIMQQPDLGTTLVMIAIITGIILVSGITWKIILPVYGSITLFGGTVLAFVLYRPDILEKYLGVEPYQFGRIYSWLDPYNYSSGEGYHLVKSLLAIGSGQITGKGYQESVVYLPENHTDFIFSVIGEEYGFLGASVVISLFFMLIYHITKTAIDTKDPFNGYVCAGIISMITFHVFQNIGMTIQLLPITGIPLPFISYGGSSLMGNMLAMGILFSMRFYHRDYMFSSNQN
ncbi:cell cycle protein [Bacillus coahuilensis m2-6]|uniref:FtsW/RodA/SpoVE family cell cycle protein n=1 Tax=Bacillus coahuilensis TaxID=408580 RepID=UPI000185070E|nr:FtsW/RodA/SpoVE family cell cycle protein [Bacillus coahuilensis]KUP04509.1 cell cycle protein [Bacillus coahuilensis m2-6]